MSLSLSNLKQRNNVILVILIFLGICIALGLFGIISGFLGFIIIYVIFRPLNIYLQEKRKWNKSLSTALILITSFVCLIIPIFLIVKLIADRVMFYVNDPEQTEEILKNINTFTAEKLNDPNLIQHTIDSVKQQAAGYVSSIINSAAGIFIQVIVMYFTLYFTIKYFREFERGLINYLPFKRDEAITIGNKLRSMTYSNILGQGFIAIVQGSLLGLGFWIFGIPEPIFWGVIGIFVSMIPMFGAPLIFIPAAIIEISNDNVFAGVGIIIYGYLIVTTIDNFIRMAIGKKIANTHPLITIVGVVIGIPLFGILGILYGPLVLSLFIILLNIYKENRVEIQEVSEAAEK